MTLSLSSFVRSYVCPKGVSLSLKTFDSVLSSKECFEDVSRKFQECFKEDCREFQGYLKRFIGYFKKVSKVFKEVQRLFPER